MSGDPFRIPEGVAFAVLDEERVARLAIMFAASRKAEGRPMPTWPEVRAVLEWADRVLVEAGTVENIMAGRLYVDYQADAVTFRLSPLGAQYVEQFGGAEL